MRLALGNLKALNGFAPLILVPAIMLTSMWLSSKYMAAMPKPLYDSGQYFAMAYNMAKYGVSSISTDDHAKIKPDSFREPVPSFLLSLPLRVVDLDRYPFSCFLAAEKTVCADMLKWVGAVNAVVVALIILSIYAAVYWFTSSPWWAIAAAAMAGTSSIMPSLTRVFTSEFAAALFLLWHSILLYGAIVGPRRRICALGSGVSLALLILSKAVYLYWMIGLLGAAGMMLLLARRLRSRNNFIVLLLLMAPAVAGVGAWMTRNHVQLGHINVTDRSIAVLALRAGYTRISWKQYFSGYVYFMPYIGFDLAKRITGDVETFDDNGPAGAVRHIQAGMPTTQNASPDQQLREIFGLMLQNWDKQLALIPLMIYRGMFIGGCCSNPGSDVPIYWTTGKLWKWLWPIQAFLTLLLTPAMVWLAFRMARRKNWAFFAFCGPVLFHFLIYGVATQFLARFSFVVYPSLVVMFVLLLWTFSEGKRGSPVQPAPA